MSDRRAMAVAWAAEVAADPWTVFLDTETTGLGPDAEIVDIAMVALDGTALINSLVKPKRLIPAEASAVHGITGELIEGSNAPTWSVLYPLISSLLTNHRLVIYNAQYDIRVIEQCCVADGLIPLKLRYDCAMLAYSDFDGTPGKYPGSMKWHKLDAAVARFGIDPGGHRALADAEACRRLVLAMAGEATTQPVVTVIEGAVQPPLLLTER